MARSRVSAPRPDMKFEARCALNTLAEADRIRRNKTLMRAVKAEAKDQIKTVQRVLPTRRK